jgi:site-specific recombinase XerD
VAALLARVRDGGVRACLAAMYSCGLRIAEATRLSVKDIDSKAMVIRVIGKGNKERLVPLCPGLLEQLRAHYKTHRHPLLVFPNQRGKNPLWPSAVEKVFQLALDEAGIEGHFTPHSLRHSFACRLLECKVPGETLRIVMGHGSLKMTQRYLHLTEPVRRALGEVVQSLHVGPAK